MSFLKSSPYSVSFLFFYFLQQAWNFFISSLLSLLTKHSCQVPADRDARTLNPIILLQPAPSSGISYEALQYPVPMDQYQLIPLVINTGKIPLINHAVQAPIQYFVPGGENQRAAANDGPAARRSTTTATTPQHRGPKPAYSDDAARTSNRPGRGYNRPPATMYSETRVGSRPAAASRYNYGYKIIDGRHESTSGGGGSATAPDESERFAAAAAASAARTGDGSRARVRGPPQNPADGPSARDESGASGALSLRPIVVKPDPKTTKTALKKRYKTVENGTKSETPINAANANGIIVTTLRP